MKKTSITFLFVSYYLASICQTYNTVIPDKAYSDFFSEYRTGQNIKKLNAYIRNWDIKDVFDSTQYKYMTINKSVWANDSVRKYFSKNDSVFIRQQVYGAINSIWKNAEWQGANLLDSVQMKKVYYNGYCGRRKKMDVYAFSIPLFSADFDYVIIQKYYTCGFMCSSWCYYLYRKTPQNKWIEITKWECLAT